MHQICKRIKKWRATVFSWDKLEEWGILHIMKGRRECVTINRSWTCNSYNIHYSMVSMRAENRSSEVAGHLSWIQRVCAIAGAQCWGGGRGSHFILQIRYHRWYKILKFQAEGCCLTTRSFFIILSLYPELMFFTVQLFENVPSKAMKTESCD